MVKYKPVMVQITEATHQNVEAMVAFGFEFWEQTGYYKQGIDYDPESCGQLTHHLIDNGIVLVAQDQRKVVGLLLMIVSPVPFNANVLAGTEVVYYVTPKYRKDGLGFLILKKAEWVAKDKGVKLINMIHLDSVEPQKAEAVYKRMGYEKTETIFTKDLI